MRKFFGLVVCLLTSFLPTVAFAESWEDPRFDVTSYIYLSQYEYDSHGALNIEESQEDVLFEIRGDFKNITFECDNDFFEDEYYIFGQNEERLLPDKKYEDGRVFYKLRLGEIATFQFFARVKSGISDEVVICDIYDYEFNGVDKKYEKDEIFSLGLASIFRIGGETNYEYYNEKLRSDNKIESSVYVDHKFENNVIEDMVVTCSFDGVDSPLKEIVINDKVSIEPHMVDKKVRIGQFQALDGFWGVQDFYDASLYDLILKENYYTYTFENVDYEMSEDDRQTSFDIDFIFSNIQGDVECSVPKFYVNQDGEVNNYYFTLPEILINKDYGYGEFGLNDVYKAGLDYKKYKYLKDEGIVHGYPDGSYRPDDKISRAEAAKIINEAFYEGSGVSESCFNDVLKAEWYSKHVCNLKDKGVIAGVGNGESFEPERTISLVEAYKMIALAFEGVENSFKFESDWVWWKPYYDYFDERYSHQFYGPSYGYDWEVTRGYFAGSIYNLIHYDKLVPSYIELLSELNDAVDQFEKVENDYTIYGYDFNVKYECDVANFEKLKKAAEMREEIYEIFDFSQSNLNEYQDFGFEHVAYSVRFLGNKKSINVLDRTKTYSLDVGYEFDLVGLAVDFGCIDVVDYYLDKLPEYVLNDHQVFNGMSLLHVAVNNKDMDMIKYLVEEKGAGVNYLSHRNLYATIFFAVDDLKVLKGNEIEIVQYLLDKGADINKQTFSWPNSMSNVYKLAATEEIRQFVLDNGYELTESDLELENNN